MKSVTVHNKSARIKHVTVGGGRSIPIAPTETPTAINFETDEEAKRFTDALKSPAIKKWVDAGELEIGGHGQAKDTASAAPSAFTAPPISKAEPEPPGQNANVAPAHEPESARPHKRGRE